MTFAWHATAPPPARMAQARAIEASHTSLQNARAARTVADHSADAEDCVRLLAMLGLDAEDGKLR